MTRLRARSSSLRRGKPRVCAPSRSLRRGKPLRTRVLACAAALTAIVLIAAPGSRSFAAELAVKIVHLRPGATAGPIPFILDLHKHKRTSKAPARRTSSTPAVRPHADPKASPHAHPGRS
jgi:hypothetical protein